MDKLKITELRDILIYAKRQFIDKGGYYNSTISFDFKVSNDTDDNNLISFDNIIHATDCICNIVGESMRKRVFDQILTMSSELDINTNDPLTLKIIL